MENKLLTTAEERAVIRERWLNTTPGPWTYDTYNTVFSGSGEDVKTICSIPDEPTDDNPFGESGNRTTEQNKARGKWYAESESNANAIAHARTDIPALLDDIEARERELCLRDAILQQAPQPPPLNNFPIDIGWMKSYREWWIGRLRNVDPLECAAKDAEIARERQMWMNACGEVFVRPESISLIGNFDNPVRQSLQPFVAEIARLREALREVRKPCAEIVQGKKLVGVSARIKLAMGTVLLIDRALTPPPERTPEQAE